MSRVVLLHGLGGTRITMLRIGHALRRAGYHSANLAYPSTRFPIEELAAIVLGKLRGILAEESGGLDFVTYSMGGVVLRQMAAELPGLVRRAVMLAPPNRGSSWAVHCRTSPLLRPWVGPAARQLGLEPDSLPRRLGPVGFPLGVIAGTRPDNPLAPRLFDGPNDGRVSVDQTRVEGASAWRTFPYGHFELPFRRAVIGCAIYFLENEAFPD